MTLAVCSRISEAVAAGNPLVRRVGEAAAVDDNRTLPGFIHQGEGHLLPLRVGGQELALSGDVTVRADLQVPDLGRSLRRLVPGLLAEQRRSAPGQQYRRQCQQGGGFCQMVFHRKSSSCMNWYGSSVFPFFEIMRKTAAPVFRSGGAIHSTRLKKEHPLPSKRRTWYQAPVRISCNIRRRRPKRPGTPHTGFSPALAASVSENEIDHVNPA